MTYPRAVMKMSELKKMGFPEKWLLMVYRTKNKNGLAWKASNKKNSPILFDTERLEKVRIALCVPDIPC